MPWVQIMVYLGMLAVPTLMIISCLRSTRTPPNPRCLIDLIRGSRLDVEEIPSWNGEHPSYRLKNLQILINYRVTGFESQKYEVIDLHGRRRQDLQTGITFLNGKLMEWSSYGRKQDVTLVDVQTNYLLHELLIEIRRAILRDKR